MCQSARLTYFVPFVQQFVPILHHANNLLDKWYKIRQSTFEKKMLLNLNPL